MATGIRVPEIVKLARALLLMVAGAAAQQTGDLLSAESILKVHRAEKGEDAEYLLGLAWLARGAAMLGDWPAASAYAQEALDRAQGHPEASYALGTALDAKAQALAAGGKKAQALEFLEESGKAQAAAPFNLRARLWKRWNQTGLVGTKAPVAISGLPPGKPTVLFLWAEWCGDCKDQAADFRRTVEKYTPRGVLFAAPTRFYTEDHAAEKLRLDQVWKEVYGALTGVSIPIADEAMLRYGVSSTPTLRDDRQDRGRPVLFTHADDRTASGRRDREVASTLTPAPQLELARLL